MDGGARVPPRAIAGSGRAVARELQGISDPAEASELQSGYGDGETVAEAVTRYERSNALVSALHLMFMTFRKSTSMRTKRLYTVVSRSLSIVAFALLALACVASVALEQARKPNILVIFGDDIGIPQISAYSLGLMGYRTPNI